MKRSPPALLLALLACLPVQAQDARWQWSVTPYLWSVSARADTTFAEEPGSASQVDNLFDTLDGAVQLHAEGLHGTWGGFADITYLGLSDDREHPDFRSEADFDTRLFELAVLWHPGADPEAGLETFAGLRYIDFDLTAKFFPTDPQLLVVDEHESRSYSDLMLGVRYTWPLSDRWSLTLRGDGSWGQTDGTWNASGVVRYRTRNGAWLLGYRYLHGDLGDGGNTVRLTADGPEVGYAFRF